MFYFIGGPARCGKTTLANQVRAKVGAQTLITDGIMRALHENLRPEWIPDIFTKVYDPGRLMADPMDRARRLYRRDVAIWPFYRSYVDMFAEKQRDEDLLIEGNVWPVLINTLPFQHRAVFLGDTSPHQAERLIALRNASDEKYWMHSYSDEGLVRWAKMNSARSQLYREQCVEHGYSYFDIAEHGLEGVNHLAFNYLMAEG